MSVRCFSPLTLIRYWLHKNIIKYCSRPWHNCPDMYEAMIVRWNKVVAPEDHVYHLGDVSLGSTTKTVEILQRLNGTKFHIWGNHDSGMRKKTDFLDEFEWSKDYHELKIQDDSAYRGRQLIVLCHYPLYTWNKASRGSWMLHGHCHGNIDEANKVTTRLDVGVDSHHYTPISYEEVKKIMSRKSYYPVDHHDGNEDE